MVARRGAHPLAVDEQGRLAAEQLLHAFGISGLGGDAGHLVHGVIARSEATKQSSGPSETRTAARWIASLRSQ
jgi:hypothetical protein